MHYTTITGNGRFNLTIDGGATRSPEVTVHIPANASSVEVGWLDADGNFNGYIDGILAAGDTARIRCGEGVQLVANITGFVSEFKIGYAN